MSVTVHEGTANRFLIVNVSKPRRSRASPSRALVRSPLPKGGLARMHSKSRFGSTSSFGLVIRIQDVSDASDFAVPDILGELDQAETHEGLGDLCRVIAFRVECTHQVKELAAWIK